MSEEEFYSRIGKESEALYAFLKDKTKSGEIQWEEETINDSLTGGIICIRVKKAEYKGFTLIFSRDLYNQANLERFRIVRNQDKAEILREEYNFIYSKSEISSLSIAVINQVKQKRVVPQSELKNYEEGLGFLIKNWGVNDIKTDNTNLTFFNWDDFLLWILVILVTVLVCGVLGYIQYC